MEPQMSPWYLQREEGESCGHCWEVSELQSREMGHCCVCRAPQVFSEIRRKEKAGIFLLGPPGQVVAVVGQR